MLLQSGVARAGVSFQVRLTSDTDYAYSAHSQVTKINAIVTSRV